MVCSSGLFGFLCYLFLPYSIFLYLWRNEHFLPSLGWKWQGGEGSPLAKGRGKQPNALEMQQKCWFCSWEPGTASQSCSVALTKKDAPSKDSILMTSDHPITTPSGKKSLQSFLCSCSCSSCQLCEDFAHYSRATVLSWLMRTSCFTADFYSHLNLSLSN